VRSGEERVEGSLPLMLMTSLILAVAIESDVECRCKDHKQIRAEVLDVVCEGVVGKRLDEAGDY